MRTPTIWTKTWIGLLSLAMLAAPDVWGQTTPGPAYTVRTVAGSYAVGDGGPAAAALLISPRRVITDSAGNTYVSSEEGTVRRISATGIISAIAGASGFDSYGDGGAATQAGMSYPTGLALDGSNHLYVAEYFGCRIRRINLSTGIIEAFAGDGDCRTGADGPISKTSFNYPTALLVDRNGGIIVSEQIGNRIRRIDPVTSTISTIAGSAIGLGGLTGEGGPATQALITSPSDLTQDSLGNVYFTDSVNCFVRKIEALSGLLRTVAGTSCGYSGDGRSALAAQLDSPRAVLVNQSGDILFVSEGSRIRRIDLNSRVITTYAGTGIAGLAGDGQTALQAQIGNAFSMAFDRSNALLVAELDGHRLRRIDESGRVSTYAGRTTFAGDGGPAIAAQFVYPRSIALDKQGGFIVADSGNGRIRAVAADGSIKTITGGGYFAASSGDGGLAINAGVNIPIAPALVDSKGNYYFTEVGGKVRKITASGVISQVSLTIFRVASGLALDAAEKFLYVAESQGGRIDRVDLSSNVVTTFAGTGAPGAVAEGGYAGDGGPAIAAKLLGPGEIAMDRKGNLFVLDRGNNRIRRISPSGDRIETIAGSGTKGSTGDGGPALSAAINIFWSLAVDSGGNVYFGEFPKIRRVDMNTGIISTIAGDILTGYRGDSGAAIASRFNLPIGMAFDERDNLYVADSRNHRVRVLSLPSTLPQIATVITAGSFGGGAVIATGTWIEIYGERLSGSAREWAGGDFSGSNAPTMIDGVRVKVNGRDAFVRFVSPGQINAQVPDGIGVGNVNVQVIAPAGTSNSFALTAAARTPALLAPLSFRDGGRQYAGALFADGSFVGRPGLLPGVAFRPAKAGDRLILYGVGFGAVNPVNAAGAITTQANALPRVEVKMGNTSAAVEYAGLAGGFVGLYQLNVVVPMGLNGDVALTVSVDGVGLTQTLFLTVE